MTSLLEAQRIPDGPRFGRRVIYNFTKWDAAVLDGWPPVTGYDDVFIHSNQPNRGRLTFGLAPLELVTISPQELVQIIRGHRCHTPGRPLRVITCEVDGEAVADEHQTDVLVYDGAFRWLDEAWVPAPVSSHAPRLFHPRSRR